MIVFETPTIIDPLTIQTFGVSVKETDNPIGFFGTGLKYAIAVLLRHHQNIVIYSDKTQYVFETEERSIRGEMHQLVKMNNQILGFTIQLGKTWKLWMAYRELWSNTMDEGGKVSSKDITAYKKGTTYIIVDGEAFEKVHQNKDDFILSGEPAWETPYMNIHRGNTSSVFYRGIKVLDHPRPFHNTYNLKGKMDLTEDRTIKYQALVLVNIAQAIANSPRSDIIQEFLTAPLGSWEQGYDFILFGSTPKELFCNVADDLFTRGALTNKSAYNWVVASRGGADYPEVLKSGMEAQMLTRAKEFCRFLGYKPDDYPIILTETLPESIFGLADMKKKRIFLSKMCFHAGTKQVAITLIEEMIHLNTGFLDETRSLQDYLLHQFVSLGEQLKGEPL